jgi:outer membrane protein assembly factor BamB
MKRIHRSLLCGLPVMLTIGLVACSSTGDKPKPAELAPLANSIGVKPLWNATLAKGTPDFELAVVGTEVVAASADGTVTRLDINTGKTLASYRHEHALSAGVGADAQGAAVVDVNNELVYVKRDGTAAWRQRLPTQVLAAPLLAKGAVFVLGMDQAVRAFDASSGSSLWVSTRTVPSLVLSRAGGLAVDGETLYAALAQGRVAALSTTSGVVRWDQAVASSRGSNEVEKLTDLVGKPVLAGGDVCVRSYQVGPLCVAQNTGRTKWNKNLSGAEPIGADNTQVIAADKNGLITSYKRDTGDTEYTIDKLKFRDLSAATILPRSFVLGDESGNLHWYNRADGAAAARLPTDGTRITTAPVQAGAVLIARTQNGLYAYSLE